MENNSTDQSLVLGNEERYDCATQRIWAWHKVSDTIDGVELRFSNMAGGFPFEAAGRTWASSEQLYLAGEFTDPSIQLEIASAKSGYAAKRFIKAKYKSVVREDFPEFRLQWMLWCVWQKCLGSNDFQRLLTSVPDDVILVEDTTTDNGGTAEIWGCRNPEQRKAQSIARKEISARLEGAFKSKKQFEAEVDRAVLENTRSIGSYLGQNNIGKILMICRNSLIAGTKPDINHRLLNSARIMIFGNTLTFSE
ncbi:MAG: NADAR family protein [Bacteroides sp.]|nr:NADAR family protein [Bacteroides sp.]